MNKPQYVQLDRAARQSYSDIQDVKLVTDNITVTAAVNLDNIKSNVDALPVNLNTFEGRISDLEDNDGIQTVTANTTATLTDGIFLVDTSSGAITITLPAASTATNKRYSFKLIDATNTFTIDGNASETIDGATTKVLSTLYDSLTIICDSSAWWII